MDAVPDKIAFKPLYILAVLIVFTPIGLLATGLPGVNGVLMRSLLLSVVEHSLVTLRQEWPVDLNFPLCFRIILCSVS